MGRLKKLGDKGWAVLDIVGRRSNELANKLGAEAFWPMSLDKESEKAAAILRAFTRDGLQMNSTDMHVGNNTKSLVKIPAQVLQQAQGLAIFTVFRTGLHLSGAGGSGVLIARQPDGSFGPPSGILLHTVGVGFLIGIDIYDTVLVLRTKEAVNAFTRPKLSIGAEMSVAAGPIGSGGALDMGFNDKAPAWAYTRSKGFYAGVALDGTIVIERTDGNERFYGRKVKAVELIKGDVQRPRSTDGLIAAIEIAEGRRMMGQWMPTGPSPYEQTAYTGLQTKSAFSAGPPPLPPRHAAAPWTALGHQSTAETGATWQSAPYAELNILPPRPQEASSSQTNPGFSGDQHLVPLPSPTGDRPPSYTDITLKDNRTS